MKRRDAIKGFAAIGVGLTGLPNVARTASAAAVEPQAPWGPISVDGTALKLTPNKQYDLSTLFPSTISVNDQSILAAPIKMFIQIGAEPLQEITGSGKWQTTDPGQVVGTWEWAGQGITLEALRFIDDDGLIIYELAFTPAAPQRIAQLYLQIPLSSGLTRYLLRFPRLGMMSAEPFKDGRWMNDRSMSRESGIKHPRSLTCHNGERGLQWACDTDAHMGDPHWGKQSNSRFEVDQSTDTMTLRFIEGLTPAEDSAATFGYKFYLYPLPPKNIIPRPFRMNRPDNETRGIADFDLPCSEGAGTEYRWMGSGIPKTEGRPTWASILAAAKRQAAGVLPYTIANCWPNADTLLPWSSEYRVAPNVWRANNGFQNPPNTQYAENGTGAPYSVDATDLTHERLRQLLLNRYQSMHRDLGSAGIYFDVAQPNVQKKIIDAWGREVYVFPILELRKLMRSVAAFYWASGGVVMQHPQNMFFPIVHSASANIWCPGEEQNILTRSLAKNLSARKRLYSNLSDYQKGAEWAPLAFGVQGTLLPQIRYDENPAISDRNGASGREYFATESMLGEALLRGMGLWHSFSDRGVVRRVYIALMQANLEKATEFRPFDGLKAPFATSSDPNGKISGWRVGKSAIVLVVVNRGDTSKAIPLTLAFDNVGTPQKLYSATGLSAVERRTWPFVSNLKGSGREWTIDVPLRCFALLHFGTQ